MAEVLWTRHLSVVQGQHVPATTIYQDNKSTILLAENGKMSSSRRTRHLDIRDFSVTHKIKKCEVKVTYCPMHKMLGFFCKATTGNIVHTNVFKDPKSSQHKYGCAQECVGKGEKIGAEKSEKKIQAGSKGKVRVAAERRNILVQQVSGINSGNTRLNRNTNDNQISE